MIFATVKEITVQGLKVQFYGETKTSNKAYTRLGSYKNPIVNDKVALQKVSGTYLILGKVVA